MVYSSQAADFRDFLALSHSHLSSLLIVRIAFLSKSFGLLTSKSRACLWLASALPQSPAFLWLALVYTLAIVK